MMMMMMMMMSSELSDADAYAEFNIAEATDYE
jgi:hypothetical protein